MYYGYCGVNMIDIFEVDRFIRELEPLKMDTIIMNHKDRERIDKYVTNGKYKGFNIISLHIVKEGTMEAGTKPFGLD